MAQYYTLEEAARVLGATVEELKQMARKNELRAFQDRGTFRFRAQEIDELARRRGMGSEPTMSLGENRPKATQIAGGELEKQMFDFSMPGESDQVEIGQPIIDFGTGSRSGKPKSAPPAPKSGPKSGPHSPPRKPDSGAKGPKSPTPRPAAGDSDVRLVIEGSDFDIRLTDEAAPPMPQSKGTPGSKRRTGQTPTPSKDSDVHLVGDDQVVIDFEGSPKARPDSDVRLAADSGKVVGSGARPLADSGPRPQEALITEEIDLDAEKKQADEASKTRQPKTKPRPASQQAPKAEQPAASPFELSDSDLELPSATSKSGEKTTESSDDFQLSLSDDEVELGEMPAKEVTGAPDSGINLQDPADSGISLEKAGEGGDQIEFELNLENAPKTSPRTPPGRGAAAAPDDSDSEFELTLDESGGLAPIDSEAGGDEDQKDIFETDFELPALDEESQSEAVALEEADTDLESSDFDLAASDDDLPTTDESGSQVVALEDEEADEGATTVHRPVRKRKGGADTEEVETLEDVDELLEDEVEAVVEEEEAVTRPAVAAAPANWGPLPAIGLAVCVFIMFLVALMAIELFQSSNGYHQSSKPSGLLVRTLAGIFTELPKE